jgi:L-asparaginase
MIHTQTDRTSCSAWAGALTVPASPDGNTIRLPGEFFTPLKSTKNGELLLEGLAATSILELGGTIASVPGADGKAPALSFAQILRGTGSKDPWPELYVAAPGSRKYYFGPPMESSALSFADIMRVVDRLYYHTRVAESVVVTCGTDRLADIAKMASLMLQDPPCPIIFTGAQLTLSDPRNDVERNLRDSLLMAKHLDPGVYIVFGGRVLNAMDAYKFSTEELDAFRSYSPGGDLGSVDSFSNKFTIHEERYLLPSEKRQWLKTYGRDELGTFCDYDHNPNVASMDLNMGSEAVVTAVLQSPTTAGLVLKIPGTSGISTELAAKLSEAAKYFDSAGNECWKPVVLVTKCVHGATRLGTYSIAAGVEQIPGIISANEVSAEAAVVLLQWGLGATSSSEPLRALFRDPSKQATHSHADRGLLFGNPGKIREPWDFNPFPSKMRSYGYAKADPSLRTFD